MIRLSFAYFNLLRPVKQMSDLKAGTGINKLSKKPFAGPAVLGFVYR